MRFDKPGIVKVFCDIHSHMSAAVVVLNHPWYAIPDDDGRFEIADVPTGDRSWSRGTSGWATPRCRVRVEPGRGASVEFTLPVPAP